MTISCYVIDDEPDAVELLTGYINQTPGLTLKGTSLNPVIALDEIVSEPSPDITFVDVDMRQLSGVELAGMVNPYTAVVFTTAHREFALEAYDKDVCDYLLKPFNYQRFLKCIQKTKKQLNSPRKVEEPADITFFFIKSEIKGKTIKIEVDQVLYIEGAQNYVKIHTFEKIEMAYLTMEEIHVYLPSRQFVRIHRSYIVNIQHIKVTERNRIWLKNNQSLMLGDHYKPVFLNMMDAYLVKSKRVQ